MVRGGHDGIMVDHDIVEPVGLIAAMKYPWRANTFGFHLVDQRSSYIP